jgi:uncharacterized protein GlcG (DUF336 family)
MMLKRLMKVIPSATVLIVGIATVLPTSASAAGTCPISDASLKNALIAAVTAENSGLNFDMWGTVVDRDGIVCAVVFTGTDRGSQWPGSRVISAQKANTANAFSLAGLALSTANLYAAVQPGASLFGLQESNPVNATVAYAGKPQDYGTSKDPMVGERIGGVNVFGGGLALYDSDGQIVGGIGVSGDTSCTDHAVAWRTRNNLDLDHVPAGVSASGDDNMIQDMVVDPATGHGVSAGGFGHPLCLNNPDLSSLPPIGSALTAQAN